MYLLDTNICIALTKENSLAKARFQQVASQCYISTIVLGELNKGVYCFQKVEKNLQKLNNFLTLIAVIEFDWLAAEEFGKLQGELRRMGRPTGEMDALIAAVARTRGDILVTHNTRDFENIPNLQLEDWL
jgi:tRNA(fMet)-specific endonuclease VapC